jgi:hypothetical protein
LRQSEGDGLDQTSLSRAVRQGIYGYGRGVPVKLRPLLGKREIVVSLETDDLQVALATYHLVAAEADKELELAREEQDQEEHDWRGKEPAVGPVAIGSAKSSVSCPSNN